MSAVADLLPPNATPFERALDGAVGTRFPLPTELVSAMWDADRCPTALLGFLAYQLSVDLWDEDWPEVIKRRVCRDAFALHRLKTTLAGIKAYVALAGGEVVKATRPPARVYPTSGMTAAEREAWLQTLPQLRLYPFDLRPLGSKRVFFSRTRPLFSARAYPRASRGFQLMGTRATRWDRGVETDIAYEQPAAGIVRLLLPRTTPRPFLGHCYLQRLYATTPVAARNVVTLDLSGDIGGYAVAQGLDPVSIAPTRIYQARTAPAARAFLGRRGRRWLLTSSGPRLVYDRICLNDPTRVAARRHGRVFLGHARLGSRPFEATLRVDLPLKRSPQRAARFAGHGFLKGGDMAGLGRIARAIGAAKAARDTILIDTVVRRPVRFGDGLRFGQFTFGEIRKVA